MNKELEKALTERTMTSFGVSIGTGLMLEALFDPTQERYDKDREMPKRVELSKYKSWIVNGYTLIRNVLSAVNDQKIELKKEYVPRIMDEVLGEILVIQSLLEVGNLPQNYLKIWIPEYSKLIELFNVDKDINVNYIQNTITAIDMFKKPLLELDELVPKIVSPTGYLIPTTYKDKSLLTTHMTIDLLQYDGYSLLESHTGIVKDEPLWYTKYHDFGNNDLSMLPMNDKILYILGDDQIIRGCSVKVKRELLRIATENKWSYRTSDMKVSWDIKKSDLLKETLKNFKGY